MFLTSWGLSTIERKRDPRVGKDLMRRMLGMMLPQDSGRLSPSTMNLGESEPE